MDYFAFLFFWFCYAHVYVLMRDRKEGRSKQGQINNKAKQHSTPKAVMYIYFHVGWHCKSASDGHNTIYTKDNRQFTIMVK